MCMKKYVFFHQGFHYVRRMQVWCGVQMDPNVSTVLVLVYLILFPGNTHFFILLIVVIIHRCKFENPSLQFLNVKNE